jgi:WD40 repeat protein
MDRGGRRERYDREPDDSACRCGPFALRCGPAVFPPDGRSRDCIAFDRDGTRIAIATEQGGLQLWDFLRSRTATFLDFGNLLAMCFAGEGRALWTIDHLGTLRQWDTQNFSEVSKVEFEERIVTAGFSEDGAYLATADEAGLIRIRHTLDAGMIDWIQYNTKLGAYVVGTLALDVDGNVLVTGSDDKTARLWHVGTGLEVSRVEEQGWIHHVALSPREDRLVTVSGAVARLWEIPAGRPLTQMMHGKEITGVTFNRDGTRVATACADAAVRIWDAASGRQISVIRHAAEVTAVAFSHDGRYLGTTSRDQVVRVWFSSYRDLIEEACKRLPRNLAMDEWHQHIGEESYQRTCTNLPAPVEDQSAQSL